MQDEEDRAYISEGSVLLTREGWWAVITALQGEHTSREEAFDALQKWAPGAWLDALEDWEQDHPQCPVP